MLSFGCFSMCGRDGGGPGISGRGRATGELGHW